MRVKLLNDGGFHCLSKVDFPVEVEASRSGVGIGVEVRTNQLYMVGFDVSLFFADHEFEIIDDEKPFDITKHKWSDTSIENISYDEFCICVDSPEYQNCINKNDAIAIAKHFKLTADDLK